MEPFLILVVVMDFFLRSLQEWTGYNLTPYGIDRNAAMIESVKTIFPDEQKNFATLSILEIDSIATYTLPESYDYIYWNFWGNWKIKDIEPQKILKKIISMTKKRLILGFYGTNNYAIGSDEWQKERQRILQRPQEFADCGFVFNGSLSNPTQYNQVVGWIDID